MKSRFAFLALMVAFALPVSAQGMRPGAGMMGAAPNIDTLTAQLTLTAEQKPKVAAVITTYETATKDAREFMSKMQDGGMQGMRDNPEAQKHFTTIREARTKMVTDLKAVLTPEQAAKYDELYPTRRRPGGQ